MYIAQYEGARSQNSSVSTDSTLYDGVLATVQT